MNPRLHKVRCCDTFCAVFWRIWFSHPVAMRAGRVLSPLSCHAQEKKKVRNILFSKGLFICLPLARVIRSGLFGGSVRSRLWHNNGRFVNWFGKRLISMPPLAGRLHTGESFAEGVQKSSSAEHTHSAAHSFASFSPVISSRNSGELSASRTNSNPSRLYRSTTVLEHAMHLSYAWPVTTVLFHCDRNPRS